MEAFLFFLIQWQLHRQPGVLFSVLFYIGLCYFSYCICISQYLNNEDIFKKL